jgi:hypothetical protein
VSQATDPPSVGRTPQEAKEQHRIKVLRQYAVLDTAPEQEFDELAAMAAHVCGAPIALISLVDEERQWFKAKVGQEASETPREYSFCAHALDQTDILVVPDATLDERFALNPLVTGDPGIRFYAGAPLITPLNATLGTLCVVDRIPRTLSTAQEWVMQSLARRVVIRLEQRRLREAKKLDEDGHLVPGVHALKLDELRTLVCTNPHRCMMWTRLVSFLGWPILNGHFSHAYIDGDFTSSKPGPGEIELILQTRGPYGPASFASPGRFFTVGLNKIFELYSIRLHFWMENAPEGAAEYQAFFKDAPPLKSPYGPSAPDHGIAQINLRDPEIISQFQQALDPYQA